MLRNTRPMTVSYPKQLESSVFVSLLQKGILTYLQLTPGKTHLYKAKHVCPKNEWT